MSEKDTQNVRLRLWKLFLSTLYLSAFTFGGGYVIVTLMKKKFVDEYHWIEEDEMLDLAKQGKTMLIVTHEMQFAKAVADKVIFIDQGKIVEEAAPAEFFEHPKTERARQFLNVFTFEQVEHHVE